MSEPIIVANGLTRRFGSTLAVDQLTLAIQPGEIFGFLGHNGAGKTTTVRLLNGILQPTSGSMRVCGLDPVTQGSQVRQRTGVLTETPALDDRLTARVSLRYYADLYSVPLAQIDTRIERLLAAFGLTERGDDKLGRYSKGMRQRMALARVLIHEPEVIFLDEPTSGLDPVVTREVHQLIARLSREHGRTLFLCTHNLVEAQRLCDRVAVLARGRLLALGAPAELARRFGGVQRMQLVVQPEQVGIVTTLLASRPDVHSVEPIHGDAASLMVQGVSHVEIPELVRWLVQHNIAIRAIAPQEPSLEEVYLALQSSTGMSHGSSSRGQQDALG
jgi:ABC-2 type transport system ATP-binding protein